VITPLDREQAMRAVDGLVAKGIESLAVCLLNSYANPVHERALAEMIRREHPGLMLTVSCELMPVIKEYERTSETVVNAYVRPAVTRYMELLSRTIAGLGIRAPLLVMQSSGGMMSVEASMARPMYIIECGPAAGVVASAYLARRMGLANVLTLDMGGTTAKASIIEDGEISRAGEYEVGAGISVASRLSKGGGYVIRVPSIDIAEIGAGGGSVIWLDPAGGLHSGPRSAGSTPGPACYDAGGTACTTTDANVVLGYLNPEFLAGGAVRLNRDKAVRLFGEQIAAPLGMEVEEAAYGAYMVANSNMIRAIRAVSTERGRDPRDFVLFAYGGAGPLHAAALAQELDISRVVIVPSPGLFSAFGLLFAEIEHHLCESFFARLDGACVARANAAWEEMERRALAEIEAGGYGEVKVEVTRSIDLRYTGQSSELTIPVPWGSLSGDTVAELARMFHEEHQKSYAHMRPEEAIDTVNLRVAARVKGAEDKLHADSRAAAAGRATPLRRRAYFGKVHGWLETPVLGLGDLTAAPAAGPLIVELYDSTCVVPPGCSVSAGRFGSMTIDVGQPRR
jgi:N-methylhydantoinase A